MKMKTGLRDVCFISLTPWVSMSKMHILLLRCTSSTAFLLPN